MGLESEKEERIELEIVERLDLITRLVDKYGVLFRDGSVVNLRRNLLMPWSVEPGVGVIRFVVRDFGVNDKKRIEVVVGEGTVLVERRGIDIDRIELLIPEARYEIEAQGSGKWSFRGEIAEGPEMTMAELLEVLDDLARALPGAAEKRWVASDPAFKELDRLIRMICLAVNPSVGMPKEATWRVDLPEAELRALIATLKEAMRRLLREEQEKHEFKFKNSALAAAIEDLDFEGLADFAQAAPGLMAGVEDDDLRDRLERGGFSLSDDDLESL